MPLLSSGLWSWSTCSIRCAPVLIHTTQIDHERGFGQGGIAGCEDTRKHAHTHVLYLSLRP